MKILDFEKQSLSQLIEQRIQGDYVYAYPPRQSYVPFPPEQLYQAALDSLGVTKAEQLNVYIHVPFCRQICSYCNLYAVKRRGADDDETNQYIGAVIEEYRRWWAPHVSDRRLDTVYIGGGTPSLLTAQQVDSILRAITLENGSSIAEIPEVALEVDPGATSAEALKAMFDVGINRINMGLQTTDQDEFLRLGRRGNVSESVELIQAALGIGFRNVCVDLIYCLPGQTRSAWRDSIAAVIDLAPPTICAYPFTARPFTAFAEYARVDRDYYEFFDIARDMLEDAGYASETHVRYVRQHSQGGYMQKANHWAGQDILGVGAGARGYLRHLDYRNGYSITPRQTALNSYFDAIRSGRPPLDSGFVLSEEEQARKRIILGLLALDRHGFKNSYGVFPEEYFPEEFASLLGEGLFSWENNELRTTRLGWKYRDLAAQLFFSATVRDRLEHFDYREGHVTSPSMTTSNRLLAPPPSSVR